MSCCTIPQTKLPLLQQYGDRIVQAMVRRSTCLSMNKYLFYVQVMMTNTPSLDAAPSLVSSFFILTILIILLLVLPALLWTAQCMPFNEAVASTLSPQQMDRIQVTKPPLPPFLSIWYPHGLSLV